MLKKMFAREKQDQPRDIVVVSGLPRSGTSMMMKMLIDGGLPAVKDSLRTADDDNPNGYFEFESVRQLATGNIKWLEDSRGKVVKIISPLLEHLPAKHHYRVIFMQRSLQEILASQKKMLTNRGEDSIISDQDMEEQFEKHLVAVKYWLARQPNMEVLYIEYGKMLESPASSCAEIASFLGAPVDLSKMQAVPDQSLYRNRAAG